VLELALREALSLGHDYIGTEHILLGLARENSGVASRILLDLGADADKIRNEMIRLLSGARGLERVAETAVTQNAAPVQETLAPWTRAAPLIHWTGIAVGALALALGLLVGWLIWG
jgi:ATP-dependent Clp protease ATP-binding subunit ClpC